MMRPLLLALPFVILATASHANYFNGRDLLRICAAGAPDCRAYIAGVVDAMEAKAYEEGRRGDGLLRRKLGPFTHCWPDRNTRIAFAVETVQTYLEAHPDELVHPAPEIISRAFSQAFACPEET